MRYYTTSQPQLKNRVTQDFWARPEFYSQWWLKWHEWTDINDTPWVPTPVYAVEDGEIKVFSGWEYGNRIELHFNKWLIFSYCHLSEIYTKEWDIVKAWDHIGMTGNTASYDMPIHLHFMCKEVNSDGENINHDNWYSGSVFTWIEEGKLYCELTQPLKDDKPLSFIWLPIVISDIPKGTVNASYDWRNISIIIYPRFLKYDELKQKSILIHEYMHHIMVTLLPRDHLKTWYKKSKNFWYVSEYAKKNPLEDASECVEEYFKSWSKFIWDEWTNQKVKVAVQLYNHYVPEENRLPM